jgi:hypothetical protein
VSGFGDSVRALTPVTVSTRDFELAHGKKPRGRGHWAFYFKFNRLAGGCVDPWFVPGEQLYSAAKKAAIAEARRRGFNRVEVGS